MIDPEKALLQQCIVELYYLGRIDQALEKICLTVDWRHPDDAGQRQRKETELWIKHLTQKEHQDGIETILRSI